MVESLNRLICLSRNWNISWQNLIFMNHFHQTHNLALCRNGALDNKQQLRESFNLNPTDINSEQVLHYKKLQEMEIPSKYKLTLVDFGGQSVFNVLHAFFISRYSIYLVVFDMELFLSFDENKKFSCLKELNFWLITISLHTFDSESGKTAPVAIVGTRNDIIN